jgi:hypothetical protein
MMMPSVLSVPARRGCCPRQLKALQPALQAVDFCIFQADQLLKLSNLQLQNLGGSAVASRGRVSHRDERASRMGNARHARTTARMHARTQTTYLDRLS